MADKTKTIKNATDYELDELITRLRKEREVQELVASLDRNSKDAPNRLECGPYDSGRLGVSTEAPIESLYHKANDILAHFGILGMKWGVRRPVGPDGLVKGPRRPKAEDYTRAHQLKKHNIKTLSNKDIKEINSRLQLEKSMRDLKKADLTQGQETVKAMLGVGTTMASVYALTQTPSGQALKKSISNYITPKVIKRVMPVLTSKVTREALNKTSQTLSIYRP